jgi:hypothetical protein
MKYENGKRYRVVRDGASLSGMVAIGSGAWRGWSRKLAVGEILTCTGYRRGWGSDPITEVTFDDAQAKAARAGFVAFEPSRWGTPVAGYIEPVDQPATP